MTLLRCHFKKLTHHPEKSGKHLMLETFTPSRPTLPLTVEVYSTDGRSKAILLGECPGVEVFAIPVEAHHLSASLSEQDEHEAVDPGRGLRRFVVN